MSVLPPQATAVQFEEASGMTSGLQSVLAIAQHTDRLRFPNPTSTTNNASEASNVSCTLSGLPLPAGAEPDARPVRLARTSSQSVPPLSQYYSVSSAQRSPSDSPSKSLKHGDGAFSQVRSAQAGPRAPSGAPGVGPVGTASLSSLSGGTHCTSVKAPTSSDDAPANQSEAVAPNNRNSDLDSPNSQPTNVSVFGQAILVASRLGAHARAAWLLLRSHADACEAADHSSSSPRSTADPLPFQKFCEATKTLLLHKIIIGIQRLLSARTLGPAEATSALHHVLLWQYMQKHTVLDLFELLQEQPTTQASSTSSSYLLVLGVPLLRQVFAEAAGLLHMGSSGRSVEGGEQLDDMLSVLSAVYEAAFIASPSCLDNTVAALAGNEAMLHRAAEFLQTQHALVTQILAGVDYAPSQLPRIYCCITLASGLLDAEAVTFSPTAALTAAQEAVGAYQKRAAAAQRRAKEMILDARISAARGTLGSAGHHSTRGSPSVGSAVAKAFRSAYLFPELKELLDAWRPVLQGFKRDSALPLSTAADAAAAVRAAFEVASDAVRFQVPADGFLLVWTLSPYSPVALSLLGTPAPEMHWEGKHPDPAAARGTGAAAQRLALISPGGSDPGPCSSARAPGDLAGAAALPPQGPGLARRAMSFGGTGPCSAALGATAPLFQGQGPPEMAHGKFTSLLPVRMGKRGREVQ